MTLVEFFDEEAIDNAMGTLLLHPVRTVFLCPGEENRSFLNALNKLLEKRKITTYIVMETIDISSVESAKRKIEEIVKKYPDCDFDIAGGSDEMLVAIGEVAKEYKLPLHSVNVRNRTVIGVNNDKVYNVHDTYLTVEELILIHGGRVGKESKEKETYTWKRNPETEKDIEKAWDICRQDPGAWNTAIGAMRGYHTNKKSVLTMMWSKLKKEGLVRKDNVSVKYKNDVVKYILTKQGTALEMFTYITAKSAEYFDDGQSGVVIDWKGRREVENEIDVLLTCGAVGYFISCKNGLVDSDELYKLSTVARRFGGKYAKKILVLSRFEPDMSFMNRADEMGIKVIKNVRHLKKADFAKRLIM